MSVAWKCDTCELYTLHSNLCQNCLEENYGVVIKNSLLEGRYGPTLGVFTTRVVEKRKLNLPWLGILTNPGEERTDEEENERLGVFYKLKTKVKDKEWHINAYHHNSCAARYIRNGGGITANVEKQTDNKEVTYEEAVNSLTDEQVEEAAKRLRDDVSTLERPERIKLLMDAGENGVRAIGFAVGLNRHLTSKIDILKNQLTHVTPKIFITNIKELKANEELYMDYRGELIWPKIIEDHKKRGKESVTAIITPPIPPPHGFMNPPRDPDGTVNPELYREKPHKMSKHLYSAIKDETGIEITQEMLDKACERNYEGTDDNPHYPGDRHLVRWVDLERHFNGRLITENEAMKNYMILLHNTQEITGFAGYTVNWPTDGRSYLYCLCAAFRDPKQQQYLGTRLLQTVINILMEYDNKSIQDLYLHAQGFQPHVAEGKHYDVNRRLYKKKFGFEDSTNACDTNARLPKGKFENYPDKDIGYWHMSKKLNCDKNKKERKHEEEVPLYEQTDSPTWKPVRTEIIRGKKVTLWTQIDDEARFRGWVYGNDQITAFMTSLNFLHNQRRGFWDTPDLAIDDNTEMNKEKRDGRTVYNKLDLKKESQKKEPQKKIKKEEDKQGKGRKGPSKGSQRRRSRSRSRQARRTR